MPALSGSPSSASARLVLPPLSLSQCVRAFMVRDTRGMLLDAAQRVSYFPCTPWCTITWVLEGDVAVYEQPPGALSLGECRALPGPIVFTGPWTRPVATLSSGPVHLLKVLFLPDAWTALTGIAPGDWLNRSIPVQALLSQDWALLCAAVRQAESNGARLALLQNELDRRWQTLRPTAGAGWQRMDDWSQGLLLRAATSALGRSVRQVERRIKGWTGQTLRELRGMGKSERAFFDALDWAEPEELRWADLAQQAGFADQSHLCRQTRRFTGFSPEELRRGILQDEAFWSYRVWGMDGDRQRQAQDVPAT